MQEVVKTSRPIDVDEADVISLEEAARIRGCAMSVIGNMLDRGRLPWYQWRALDDAVEGERVQRFTSRMAVMALSKKGKRAK